MQDLISKRLIGTIPDSIDEIIDHLIITIPLKDLFTICIDTTQYNLLNRLLLRIKHYSTKESSDCSDLEKLTKSIINNQDLVNIHPAIKMNSKHAAIHIIE